MRKYIAIATSMVPITQQCRPTLDEALREAALSSDPHWTAFLSKIGMTRLSRQTVARAAVREAREKALQGSLRAGQGPARVSAPDGGAPPSGPFDEFLASEAAFLADHGFLA